MKVKGKMLSKNPLGVHLKGQSNGQVRDLHPLLENKHCGSSSIYPDGDRLPPQKADAGCLPVPEHTQSIKHEATVDSVPEKSIAVSQQQALPPRHAQCHMEASQSS